MVVAILSAAETGLLGFKIDSKLSNYIFIEWQVCTYNTPLHDKVLQVGVAEKHSKFEGKKNHIHIIIKIRALINA